MSSGDTKPPDPAARAAPIDLARVVVKPALTELPQATHLTLPRVQPSTSVISATATSGQSIFTPSPSHLIVPTAAKTASLRPPIRPLQPTPVVGANVQKIVATPQITPQAVKTPTVVPHVTRSPVIPMQNKQRPQAPTASLIRAPQFTSHVPRGPATVASITAGPKTAVATPIIRQTAVGGQNVVVTSNHIPAAARASSAALTPTRSFAPVTMVEVSKPQQPAGQLHLGIQPSITIESGVRATGVTQKQTVVGSTIYQPVVAGEKGASTTTLFKTAAGSGQFSKATTFTPITTSQPQAIVQPVSSTSTSQAVTITGKTIPVSNSTQFSKLASPVFVTNKNAVSNVVITTSQRPVRNVSTTQVTTTINPNLSIPVTKVFQQPLTVTGSDMEQQPQPIGFVTGTSPRLQLPVISVGQNVQGSQSGTVVLTGDANRGSGATQYAVPAGAFLTYETYAPYFGGQGATPTPLHLTTAAIPGVRTVSPRPPFTTPRPLMVTVDTKVHQPSTNNVISVTATKANNHVTTSAASSVDTSNLVSTGVHGDVTLPRLSSETTITKLTTPGNNSTGNEHTTKLANLTEKVITQALATPVNPPTTPLPLPISVTGITSSTSISNQVSTIQTTQGSPSRPSILRKRPASSAEHFSSSAPGGSTIKRENDVHNIVVLKQEIEDNNNSLNDSGPQQNGQVSPRKKPRKQLLQSSEIDGGSERTAKRQENGREETNSVNQRPQLFGGQQHGWKARLNHFLRHSDVRCRDDKKPSVNELANQKSAAQRAHGWKLYHIKGQVEEVETIESDVFHRFNKILESFEAINRAAGTAAFSPDDEKVLNKITDLIKGNLQRSKIMQDQVGEVKKQLVKVLDHKTRVLDVIGKHISKRPLKKREKL